MNRCTDLATSDLQVNSQLGEDLVSLQVEWGQAVRTGGLVVQTQDESFKLHIQSLFFSTSEAAKI